MKRAVITGASRGIGRATALLFAENGYEVGFTYNNSRKEALELFDMINSISKAYMYQCDFSNSDNASKCAEHILSELGDIDVLVNNAGTDSWGLFQDVDNIEFDRVFNTDFKSMFLFTSVIAKKMITRNLGSIVNIASVWGETGASCEVLYSSAKASVIGFTKALAKELAPSGIRVNSISPGVVDTDMMKRFSEIEREEIASEIPLGRFASPLEIAKACLFIAGDDASFITGQDIAVNGGMYC